MIMKNLSLIFSLAGIFILSIVLIISNPLKITSQEDLSKLPENSKVLISGNVIKQTASTILLDSNIQIYCKNCPPYLNKNISIIGFFNGYLNRTNALRIVQQN